MTVANTPNDGNLTPDQIAARDAVIQADYCAGIKPLRQIGSEHSLSHTAIGKMAKERGWIRNLKARIQAKADSKVAKAAVSKADSKTVLATENAVVEANAQLQYQVRIEHRQAIKRGRELFGALLDELETSGLKSNELEELVRLAGEELTAQQRADAKQTIRRVMSMGSRITSAKQLVEMLEKLVRLERQAFGIGDEDPGDNPSIPGGSGSGKTLSDAERAIRLARLLAGTGS